ncbi:MAG: biotin/lipoyl-containing protein, partial [bacterium]
MYQARIRMPRMGTSVHEGTVVEWKKSIGDRVSKGESLLSAESDKVEFEVESPADGVVKEILAEAEATVAVGDVLAILETEEEVAEEEPDTAPSSGPPKSDEWVAPVAPLRPTVEKKPIPLPSAGSPSTPPLTARPGSGAGLLSPRVQRFAARHGLDLTTVSAIPGTGAGGRVTARDVEQYIQQGERAPTVNLSFLPIAENENREERAPFNRLRKRIAENLTRSVRDIPQVTSYLDVDMSHLVRW